MFLAVLFVSVKAQSNDLILGEKTFNDHLLLQEPVEEPYTILWKTSRDKTFTTPGQTDITRLEVLDRKSDGTGAYVSLLGGGVGHNFVSLRFESQWNHGIHFIVNLYGH